MERYRQLGGRAPAALIYLTAAALVTIPLLVNGCAAASSVSEPFNPTVLVISPDAATGPDFIARGSIDGPDDVDYYQLVLEQAFNSVVIMTGGDTDTAGQVETEDRTPITTECMGERHEATPPCVWGTDPDIDTPHPQRSAKFNSMEASKNFIWEGSLDAGTYYIRITGQDNATGPYDLTVELHDAECPGTETDPFGYYCAS